MAITVEQVTSAHPGVSAKGSFRFPTERPLHKETVEKLTNVTTELARYWVRDPAATYRQPPFLDSTDAAIQAAHALLRRDYTLRGQLGQLRSRDKLAWAGDDKQNREFVAGFLGGEEEREGGGPLIALMFNPAAVWQVWTFIDPIVRRLLERTSNVNDLATPDLLLILGWRDFNKPGVSAWVRARTCLLAKHCERRHFGARAQVSYPDPHQHFDSMAHSPSLTARQGRRSATTQGDLRARWT